MTLTLRLESRAARRLARSAFVLLRIELAAAATPAATAAAAATAHSVLHLKLMLADRLFQLVGSFARL